MTTSSLTLALLALHSARGKEAAAKKVVAEKKAEFEKTIAAELEAAKLAIAERESAELAARTLAVEAFEKSGRKEQAEGVTVTTSETTKLVYPPAKALEWAKSKGMFLALNVEAFEVYAKSAPGDLDFLTLEKVTTFGTRIASDLSKLAATLPAPVE